MKPILTIAIPTYNRPEKIYTQVMALVPQITDEVRLIVQDNHSDTPVESLFEESVKEKCTFLRNKQNIGADANIAKCVDLCETQWLLILGDDDPMESWAVETILSDIKNAGEKTVFLNYDPTREIRVTGIDGFLKCCDNRYWCLFWMSGCVYNTDLLKDCYHQYFYSISTMQPNIVLLVNSLIKHPDYSIWITGKNIHKEAGADIHWNRDSYIYASLFVFDVLWQHYDLLKGTLFSAIAGNLYRHIITISKHEKNRKHTWHLMRTIAKRRGLCNTLRYDFQWYKSCFYHGLITQK